MTQPTLSPDVREALARLDRYMPGSWPAAEYQTIRAELMRLAEECARKNDHWMLVGDRDQWCTRALKAESERNELRAKIENAPRASMSKGVAFYDELFDWNGVVDIPAGTRVALVPLEDKPCQE